MFLRCVSHLTAKTQSCSRVLFLVSTFFSSVSAKAASFFSSSKFLKLLFCWTSWMALTNLLYSSSRSLWVYKTLTKKHSHSTHHSNNQRCGKMCSRGYVTFSYYTAKRVESNAAQNNGSGLFEIVILLVFLNCKWVALHFFFSGSTLRPPSTSETRS